MNVVGPVNDREESFILETSTVADLRMWMVKDLSSWGEGDA